MNKKISQSGMCMLCLLSFILFCSVFTIENAFSERYWKKDNILVTYDQSTSSITFDFVIYEYSYAQNKDGYLQWCGFTYSEGGKDDHVFLMKACAKYLKDKDQAWISMSFKRPGEKLLFLSCVKPENAKLWQDHTNVEFEVSIVKSLSVGPNPVNIKRSDMSIRWNLPRNRKPIKSIKIIGEWKFKGGKKEKINDLHEVKYENSNSISINNAPSVLKSEIGNDVKIIRETDAITVTGVEPGENIKVYTVSGAEVKSVVANDDVVNIKLAKNQLYIVKTGQASYKVAL